MPGFDAIEQDFLPKEADLEAARRYLERASAAKRTLSLFYSTSDVPAAQIAVAVQAMWKRIGLRIELHGLEAELFYELVGPPMDGSIDVFVWGTLADFGDDMTVLETLTCRSGYNPNGYCDARYDRLIERARSTPGRGRSAPDLRAGGSDADRSERRAADHPDVLGVTSDVARPRRRGLATESVRPARLHQGDGPEE